jgi:hypothetical protein
MKKFLKEKVEELYSNGFDFYELQYELFGDVKNWPIAALPSFEDSGELDREDYDDMVSDMGEEPQDMENFEWNSITEDELVISCGGDWQRPMKITMNLINDELVVTDTEDDVYDDGMSEEEFNEILEIEL